MKKALRRFASQLKIVPLALCLLCAADLAHAQRRPINSPSNGITGSGIPPATSPQQQSRPTVDNSMAPLAEFHMARMVYQDGGARNRGRYGIRRGWWAIDYPEAELHFFGGV